MKPKLLLLLLWLLPACAPQASTPRSLPSSGSATSANTATGGAGPATNSFSADATDCERQAALASAGGKAAAFESCMRARGRTPSR